MEKTSVYFLTDCTAIIQERFICLGKSPSAGGEYTILGTLKDFEIYPSSGTKSGSVGGTIS